MCRTDVKVYSKREPTDCSHPVEIMLFVKKKRRRKRKCDSQNVYLNRNKFSHILNLTNCLCLVQLSCSCPLYFNIVIQFTGIVTVDFADYIFRKLPKNKQNILFCI